MCSSAKRETFNKPSFSCFNYGTQIRRTSLEYKLNYDENSNTTNRYTSLGEMARVQKVTLRSAAMFASCTWGKLMVGILEGQIQSPLSFSAVWHLEHLYPTLRVLESLSLLTGTRLVIRLPTANSACSTAFLTFLS